MRTYKFSVLVYDLEGESVADNIEAAGASVAEAYENLTETVANKYPDAYDYEITGETMQGINLGYFEDLGELQIITEL